MQHSEVFNGKLVQMAFAGPYRTLWNWLSFAGCRACRPETSSIVISETNYNFGELSEMASLSHDFIVKNSGKAILDIRDVQPS